MYQLVDIRLLLVTNALKKSMQCSGLSQPDSDSRSATGFLNTDSAVEFNFKKKKKEEKIKSSLQAASLCWRTVMKYKHCGGKLGRRKKRGAVI